MKINNSALILHFALITITQCAKILGVFPYPSISHQQGFVNICKELSLRGHQVTIITPNPLRDENLKNLREIDVSHLYNHIAGKKVENIWLSDRFLISILFDQQQISGFFAEVILKTKAVQDLLKNDEEHFDIILLESHVRVFFAFGEKYKAPIIAMSSLGVHLDIYDTVGNPNHPFLTSHVLSLDFPSASTSFYQRLNGLFYHVWYRIAYEFVFDPAVDKIVRKYFGDDMPSVKMMGSRISLILSNVNSVIDTVRPNLPTVVNTEFLHIMEPQGLPKDIQEFLDSSTDVVYFSLGSNIKSTHLANNTLANVIQALANLPYNVLWKYEGKLPDELPNVLIRQWFPQQDILAHPNIKVFVTQGGLQSIEESIANGVPMVGLPFLGDQPRNIKRVEHWGMGIMLDISSLSTEDLEAAIVKIVTNNSYKENVIKCKSYIEDQPIYGVKKAVWWIEYVLRHNGTNHLRYPGLDVPLYKYLLLDVLIVILILILFVSYVIIKCISFIKCNKKSKTD